MGRMKASHRGKFIWLFFIFTITEVEGAKDYTWFPPCQRPIPSDLDVDAVTHLGGVPDRSYIQLIRILKDADYALSLPSKAFTGCINNLKLYDFEPNLSSSGNLISFGLLTKGVSECGSGPCTVESNPCKNGAKCNVKLTIQVDDDFGKRQKFVADCDCSLGWSGNFCDVINMEESTDGGEISRRHALKKKSSIFDGFDGEHTHEVRAFTGLGVRTKKW